MRSTISSMKCEKDAGAFNPEQSQRYTSLKEDMRSAVSEIKELPDGFAFRFPSDPRIIVKLAEWMTLERQCCKFFSFVLEVEPNGGPVWLNLTGGKGVKEFLQTEISARQE